MCAPLLRGVALRAQLNQRNLVWLLYIRIAATVSLQHSVRTPDVFFVIYKTITSARTSQTSTGTRDDSFSSYSYGVLVRTSYKNTFEFDILLVNTTTALIRIYAVFFAASPGRRGQQNQNTATGTRTTRFSFFRFI